MEPKTIANGILQALLKLFIIGVVLVLLYSLTSLLLYFLVAAVISLIGRPITVFLKEKLKCNSLLAATITLLTFIGLLFGILSLFFPLLVEQSNNLSLLDVEALKIKLNYLSKELSDYFNVDNSFWLGLLESENILQSINLSLVPDFLNGLLNFLGSFSVALFSVLFISFFLLKDSELLERIVLIFIKESYHSRIQKSFERIKNLLSRYFIGLLMQITILLVIYTIVLAVFGNNNAFIIAFLCALLNLIPYLGPIFGGVLMIILTLTNSLELNFSAEVLYNVLGVFIGFTIGQLVDNFFSQPYIFSRSVKSHPLEIFFVILASGSLFGAVGMIIAIPMYTASKVILKEFFAENKIVQSLTKDL